MKEHIEQPQEKYFPFLAANAAGRIINLETMHNPSEAARSVYNGVMPEKGGLVEIQSDLGAIDLVATEIDEFGRLRVLPIDKDAVDNDSDRIKSPGEIMLTFPSGNFRIFAEAISARRGWTASRLSGTIIKPLGINATDYETEEVDETSGLIIAKPRQFRIGF